MQLSVTSLEEWSFGMLYTKRASYLFLEKMFPAEISASWKAKVKNNQLVSRLFSGTLLRKVFQPARISQEFANTWNFENNRKWRLIHLNVVNFGQNYGPISDRERHDNYWTNLFEGLALGNNQVILFHFPVVWIELEAVSEINAT